MGCHVILPERHEPSVWRGGKSGQIVALLQHEMDATKGAALWFDSVTVSFARVCVITCFGLLATLGVTHLVVWVGGQTNYWFPDVSDLGGAVRIPLSNRPLFRP